MSGPKLVAEAVPKITGKIFKRKYIMLGRLVTNWTDIVGKDLADKAQPVKITRRRQGKGQGLETTLHIAVSTAHATALHYQKNLILERINQIFGERLVTAIRFVPVTANSSLSASQGQRKRPKSLTPQQKRVVDDMLANIDDPEIHARLKRLGEAVMREQSPS